MAMILWLVLTLAYLSLAGPVSNGNIFIGAKDLICISPSTVSCAGAPFPDECRTADQAAPEIAASFAIFGLADFNTQAALVALMLFESGSFKYSINHYPGVPGQGTRNMQSPTYNTKYARFLANVQCSGITSEAAEAAIAQDPAATLALVNTDRWSFASAAWFLNSECSTAVKQGLVNGTYAGWSNYLVECIGTTVTDERTQLWHKAKSLRHWTGAKTNITCLSPPVAI